MCIPTQKAKFTRQKFIGLVFNISMSLVGLYYFVDAGLSDSLTIILFRLLGISQFLAHACLVYFLVKNNLLKYVVMAKGAMFIQVLKTSAFILSAIQVSNNFSDLVGYVVTSSIGAVAIIGFLLLFSYNVEEMLKSAKTIREKELIKERANGG